MNTTQRRAAANDQKVPKFQHIQNVRKIQAGRNREQDQDAQKAQKLKSYRFKQCWVNVNFEDDYTETVFDDGARVQARPEDTSEYCFTVEQLGYGDRAADCSREHEILHTWIAEKFGLEYSPTLWSLVHEGSEGAIPEWARLQEEQLVCDFQRYLNTGQVSLSFNALTSTGYRIEDLKAEALTLLR